MRTDAAGLGSAPVHVMTGPCQLQAQVHHVHAGKAELTSPPAAELPTACMQTYTTEPDSPPAA